MEPFLSYPLLFGEPKSLFFELILENTVFFDEIIDDCLLLAVKPAGQAGYQEMERLYGVCHCTNRLSTILIDNNIIQFVRIFAPYGPWKLLADHLVNQLEFPRHYKLKI